ILQDGAGGGDPDARVMPGDGWVVDPDLDPSLTAEDVLTRVELDLACFPEQAEARGGRFGRAVNGLGFRHECVAEALHRPNDAGIARLVAERRPQLGDE